METIAFYFWLAISLLAGVLAGTSATLYSFKLGRQRDTVSNMLEKAPAILQQVGALMSMARDMQVSSGSKPILTRKDQ